jgi:hypothetical protein
MVTELSRLSHYMRDLDNWRGGRSEEWRAFRKDCNEVLGCEPWDEYAGVLPADFARRWEKVSSGTPLSFMTDPK